LAGRPTAGGELAGDEPPGTGIVPPSTGQVPIIGVSDPVPRVESPDDVDVVEVVVDFVVLAEAEPDPLPEAAPMPGAPAGVGTPPVTPGCGTGVGDGSATGVRLTVAKTLPSEARSRRVPRTAHGPGLEPATDELIGAARVTRPCTGVIVSVAPPSNVTCAWVTDGPTTAATHHAGDPSVAPKSPLVIAETRCELALALAAPCDPLPPLVEVEVEVATADPSNKAPCPTAALSDMSSEYQVYGRNKSALVSRDADELADGAPEPTVPFPPERVEPAEPVVGGTVGSSGPGVSTIAWPYTRIVIPPAVLRVNRCVAVPRPELEIGVTHTQPAEALALALALAPPPGRDTTGVAHRTGVAESPPATGATPVTELWDSGTTIRTPLAGGRPEADAIPPAKPAPAAATSTAVHAPTVRRRALRIAGGATFASATVTSG